jgi:hypothetical protein
MIKLMQNFYKKFFDLSFDSYGTYISSIHSMANWENNRRKIYFSVNDLVFKSIYNKSFKFRANHQFILDYINYFIHNHLSDRFNFLNKSNSKSKFIIWSFVKLCFFSIKTILISIKKNSYTYRLNNISGHTDINICIGFPKHSFNYELENINNPGSFVEYLISNEFTNENDTLISIDEYLRPSLKTEEKITNSLLPKNFTRILVLKDFNYIKLIINFLIIPCLFLNYISRFRILSLSLFSYFVRNYFLSKNFNSLINKILKRNITIKNIFVLNHQNVSGLIYKGKFQKLVKQYNYGQHYVIGTSSINSTLIGNNQDLSLSKVLSELPTRLFSELHLNPINFSNYSKNFSKFRTLINEKYNINTVDLNSRIEINNQYRKEKIFSNLGYELIEKIKFKSSKNILFCDNTIESVKANFSRDIMGDILALKDFIYDFHKEIAAASNDLNYNLYFKGKYSNNKVLSSMIKEISNSLKININIINPYSKIMLDDNIKFDLCINFPFTSTHYTFNHLTNKSIYYIPTSYTQHFDRNINDICLGLENLKNILK